MQKCNIVEYETYYDYDYQKCELHYEKYQNCTIIYQTSMIICNKKSREMLAKQEFLLRHQ